MPSSVAIATWPNSRRLSDFGFRISDLGFRIRTGRFMVFVLRGYVATLSKATVSKPRESSLPGFAKLWLEGSRDSAQNPRGRSCEVLVRG
jgi:hypothetical protein